MRINQLVESVKSFKVKMEVPDNLQVAVSALTAQDWENVATKILGKKLSDLGEVVGGNLVNGKFEIEFSEFTPTKANQEKFVELYDLFSANVTLGDIAHLTSLTTGGGILFPMPQGKAFDDVIQLCMSIKFPGDDVVGVRYLRDKKAYQVFVSNHKSSYDLLHDALMEISDNPGASALAGEFKNVVNRIADKAATMGLTTSSKSIANMVVMNSLGSLAFDELEKAGIGMTTYKTVLMGFGITDQQFKIITTYLQVDEEGNDI